jgi:hypothetical protein
VAIRFQELWEVEPWGLSRRAMGVLKSIWERRRSGVVANRAEALLKWTKGDGDWIRDLKGLGVDWLIL